MNKKRLIYLRLQDQIFWFIAIVVLFFSISCLFALIFDIFATGYPRINLEFLTSYPSRHPDRAGILSAWVGTLAVVLLTALLAIPVGIGAGIYLEEFSKKNILTKLIEINILNLAGVPSIIYGLMALSIFVYQFHLGQSLITAGLTLALLILPIVIVTTREALKTVPLHIREASYALGATQWQTISHHVLPYSMGGIMTGVIIALSRAIGETAPLVTVGALTYIAFLPTSINDPYTVLPIQLYNWLSRPQQAFHLNAAAAGTVLISLTILLNVLAIMVRYKFRRKYKW